MKIKKGYLLLFIFILLLLASCSNNKDEAKDKQINESEIVNQENRDEAVNYEDELNAVQETMTKYRNGDIERELVSTNVEKHIANLESIDSNEKDLATVIESLKSLQKSLNEKEVKEMDVLKNIVTVENQVNKTNLIQEEDGGNTMIDVIKAQGILRNSFASLVGNVTYQIEGTVNNKEISELELHFTSADSEENNQNVVVPVNEGRFEFTKGYEEVFGYFTNFEIKAKKADGTPVKDSSGNEISINVPIELSVEQ